MPTQSEVSQLLQAWSRGDAAARDRLMPLVLDELKDLARRHLKREPPGQPVQTTELVHELYLKLVDQRSVKLEHRRAFFALAATLIRRLLVDLARKRQTASRGGGQAAISFDEDLGLPVERDPELIALDDALRDLEREDPRESRVVELHVFGGLNFEEVAEELGIARATAMRDWTHARLWLRRQLSARASSE